MFFLNPYIMSTSNALAGSAGIYGLRTLVDEYLGDLIILSDVNGNQTSIGRVDDELDGVAAQAAIDTGKTRVCWFADQTGLGNHFVETRFSHMPVLVLDGTPSHKPVLRFSGSEMHLLNNDVNELWGTGGYIAMGMRFNTGTGLGKFIVNHTIDDALFTFTVPTGASAHMALEIMYNSDTPTVPPTIQIDASPVTVNTIQWGGGAVDTKQSPFKLGGTGFDGDIWEVYLYGEIPA